MFETKMLPVERDVVAPDRSDVRVLLALRGGGMAHFTLAAGHVSVPVAHRTVEEIWFVLSGRGQIWRKHGNDESIVELTPGVCLTIPLGTRFQFRAGAGETLAALAVTMPPWPGDGEAYEVPGVWAPTRPSA
jgi:mannose-6-phosphate isomerase-like protein (cupin superfamily)